MELEFEPRSKTREYPLQQVCIASSSGAEIGLTPDMFTIYKHLQVPVTRRIR
jgi:hypothetical protein